MAEKIVIAAVDIDFDKAVKDTADLKQEASELKKILKDLRDQGKENSAEFVENSVQLKALNEQVRKNENQLKSYTQSNNEQLGTIERLEKANGALIAKQKKLDLSTRAGRKENLKINKQIKENTELLNQNRNAESNRIANIGKYPKAMSAATGATKAFGAVLKGALLPLTAIVTVIGLISKALTGSEKNQDKFNKVLSVAQTILGNLIDLLITVGDKLLTAILKPREAWESFKGSLEAVGNFFKNTFGNIIIGSLQVVGASFEKFFAKVGLGWEKLVDLFTDNADGIADSQKKIEEAQNSLESAQERVALGVKNTTDAIQEGYKKATSAVNGFIKETEREIEIAKRLADIRAQLDRDERASIVATAEENLNLAKLKNEIDEKTKNTAEERIQLIEEQNKILDDQLEREKELAQQRLFLAQETNKLSESTKEDLREEAELKAALFEIERRIEDQRREAIAKRLEAEREIIAQREAEAKKAIEALDAEYKKWVETNQERITRQEEFNRVRLEKELEYANMKLEQDLISQEEYNIQISTAQRLFEEAEKERKAEVEMLDFENKMSRQAENYFIELEMQRAQLQRQYENEIEYAEKIGADTTLIKEKFAQAENQINAEKANYALSVAVQTANNLVTILGETTTAGKIAATAATTISTLQSAVDSFKSLAGIPYVGPVLGGIAAAAALVAGYATVDEIWSVDTTPSVSGSKPSGGGSAKSAYSSIGSKVASAQTTAIATANTQLGQGIVARETGIQQENQVSQTAVIIDEVTAAQNIQTEKANIATQ